MSNPAVGAKYVAAVVVGLVGAGTFAGVSHDGRGTAPPENPEPIVEAPPSTVLPSTSVSAPAPAQPAAPDPVPTRARVRSRGS